MAVRQGRQALLRLQLHRHPARTAAISDRNVEPGAHVLGMEFVKERVGERRETYGTARLSGGFDFAGGTILDVERDLAAAMARD
jgi:hypothetical protein